MSYDTTMKFCSDCGAKVEKKIPAGDTHERSVCIQCGAIHYTNPKIVAGTLATWGTQVLLCQRAIEPRKGFWTLPAGFLENGETILEGAIRETREEAEAEVIDPHLYTIFSLPHISQIYIFFRSNLAERKFSGGTESLDVALFSESEIPWENLAFPVVTQTLKHFFRDRITGDFPVHNEVIEFKRRLRS